MSLRRTLIALNSGVLLALATAGAVRAQPASSPLPPTGDSILVVGARNGISPEVRFVEALAVPSRNQQLARFEGAVCPISFGLSAEDDARLVWRMRRVAQAAGLPVAEERCRPNAIVFVVPDRTRAIQHWLRDRRDFFAGLSPAEIEELAGGEDPIAAWQIVHVKGAGGRPVGRAASETFDYIVNPESSPHRIGSPIQLEFFGAFVLIEASLLTDVSIVQLADYAAMRTFAATDPDAAVAQPLPTILSLFSRRDESAPLSVTHWDLNYLRALYTTQLAAPGRDQQRAMTHVLTREMEAVSNGRDE